MGYEVTAIMHEDNTKLVLLVSTRSLALRTSQVFTLLPGICSVSFLGVDETEPRQYLIRSGIVATIE